MRVCVVRRVVVVGRRGIVVVVRMDVVVITDIVLRFVRLGSVYSVIVGRRSRYIATHGFLW